MPVVEATTMASMSPVSRSASFEKMPGDPLEQGDGVFDVKCGALGPTVIALVPIDRHTGIARFDAGVLEHGKEAGDVAAASEKLLCPSGHVPLVENVGRDSGFEGQQAWQHSVSFRPGAMTGQKVTLPRLR